MANQYGAGDNERYQYKIMGIKVVGIYRIETNEPCHLIELEINDPLEDFDMGQSHKS